jgi:hypothetical protein
LVFLPAADRRVPEVRHRGAAGGTPHRIVGRDPHLDRRP